MSEEDAQHSYVETEILIDTARVLSSSFPSIGVVLTGNELEILRNMLNYATRRRTFVGAYHNNYYLVADNDDWLDIESIVAILEEKLMGNDNTVWGYNDRLFTREDHTTLATGNWTQNHDNVPAGEVWVVQSMSLWTDVASGTVTAHAILPTIDSALTDKQTADTDGWHAFPGHSTTLKEGDHIQFVWKSLAVDQRLITNVVGYKMKVDT